MESIQQMNSMKLKALIWVAYHLEAPELIDGYIRLVANELESRGHQAVICRDLDCAKKEVRDADIVLCWRILPEVFAEAKQLKWIQFGSAGIDHTLFSELLDSNVILTTVSGIHKYVVSEHILALMLALSRRLDVAIRNQSERNYDRSVIAAEAFELTGKTVGIVGLGKIGLEFARLCKCMGMTVIGTKRRPTNSLANVDEVFDPNSLDTVLSRCDFLVLVVPLTSSTKNLVGEREIRLMKPGSYIINVARGPMVDESALADAISDGYLAGAALDVFSTEPLPSSSLLYDLPNLIITPHVAGSYPEYLNRSFEIFKENLKAFIEGETMVNVFDRERGY